jgi:RNA polymerase sigma factor (sigma-70 family)
LRQAVKSWEHRAGPRSEVRHGSCANSLRLYLREIGRHPLLTPADEVALAKAMEAGNDAQAQLENSGLSAVDFDELTRTVEAGRAAKGRFIESNLRLAFSIAKGYQQRGLPLLDLIQEANLGLIRGVEKFDYRRGFKFSTYATWWIHQGIGRAIANTARIIRLPVHVHDLLLRVHRAQAYLTEDLDRAPSIEEIAGAAGVASDMVRRVLDAVRDPISLHQPVGDEGCELGDFIREDQLPDPFEAAVLVLLCDGVRALLDVLTEREREIVVLRFGLRTGRPETLEEVGLHFALTRERIRQIEAEALSKLRHPTNRGALEALATF